MLRRFGPHAPIQLHRLGPHTHRLLFLRRADQSVLLQQFQQPVRQRRQAHRFWRIPRERHSKRYQHIYSKLHHRSGIRRHPRHRRRHRRCPLYRHKNREQLGLESRRRFLQVIRSCHDQRYLDIRLLPRLGMHRLWQRDCHQQRRRELDRRQKRHVRS